MSQSLSFLYIHIVFSIQHQVVTYIANQQEHHRKMTFQDELRTFLRKHNQDGMNAMFGISSSASISG